jgi:hypothetical protein
MTNAIKDIVDRTEGGQDFAEALKAVASGPGGLQAMPLTFGSAVFDTLKMLMVKAKERDELIGELRAKVAALEARLETVETKGITYRGVWDEATKDYRLGDVVTWGGSAWIAHRSTPVGRPGVDSAWTLCVKRGKDGRDAR